MKKIILSVLGIAAFAGISTGQTSPINSSTFTALEARWLGPGTMSGRITSIDGNNKDGKTIYVGTAGGGVWKTTNAGASFKPIFDKYCLSIGAIAVDQSNPDVVYVGTGESNMRNSVSYGDGLFKSTDGGDNWNKIGLDSTEHISKIVIDPSNPNTIYVAAPGPLWSDSKNRGLYKSTDGGTTWQKIFYLNDKTGCADIVMNPQNPNELIMTMWQFRRLPYAFNSGGPGSGMYKSTDAGKTWNKITKGLPDGNLGRIALALSPSNPSHMLAIVESKATNLFVSTDGGESWTKKAATTNVEARPFYFSTLAFDPKDDKRVYRPAFGLSISDDGGSSFTDASNEGGWVHSDMHAIWINPLYTNQVWIGTDGGVFLSNDRGITFTFIQNLPVGQFYHVAYDTKEPYNVYGGLQDNGTWVGPSQWYGGISNGDWRPLYGGDGFWAQPDPTDSFRSVYAEAQGGEAGRVDLKTGLSTSMQPTQVKGEEKLRWNWNSPIYLGANNPHNLYMAAQYLYKSTNQGRDWTRISPDLTTNDKAKQKQEESGGLSADNTAAENHCTIFTVAESPLDQNYIFAGTDDGNLQITTDAGKTWTNVAENAWKCGVAKHAWISSIEPSRFDKNTLYATFENHMYGDFNTYIAKSTDLGKTWTRLNSADFTGFARKICEDLVNKNLLFLGTERGLFATVDGGATWFRMKNHIPDYVLVHDIKIQPKTNDLIIATHGRGIIIVDDITPIRNMTQDIAQKDVYLYPLAPIDITYGKYEGGFPEHDGWVSGNAEEIPPITYYLKSRVMSSDVTVKIYDPTGKLIKELPGSKRKGLNKVTWDLRTTPPQTAKGGTKVDFGGFIAPVVLPGKYIVKLFIGDKEYDEDIAVAVDPKDPMTDEDRKQQYNTAMACIKMHEDLAKLADQLNTTIDSVKQAVTRNKDNKKLAAFLDSLQTFKGTLMATKQTSIFADEERLREKITKVYGSVTGQDAAPTNLQLENVQLLQTDVAKAEDKEKALMQEYDQKWKHLAENWKVYNSNINVK
ncbi:MAG TPA: glycosyl hydrolase [Bacteroidia bacterium]|nr:glycosyl hydrolase [Bacteroidia bacterium]